MRFCSAVFEIECHAVRHHVMRSGIISPAYVHIIYLLKYSTRLSRDLAYTTQSFSNTDKYINLHTMVLKHRYDSRKLMLAYVHITY